jgi:hypothetical protein
MSAFWLGYILGAICAAVSLCVYGVYLALKDAE